ncbi:MAG: GSCFA domain-containing protein [Bacteroidetes bacterium]|nr:GSCFA domain-containing protein [Bacteroidota bacterium]
MDWRTELNVEPSKNKITLHDRIFTIGSCFADEISNKLTENKFDVWNNRFGTVYNPISIHQLLLFGLEQTLPSSESYLLNEEINLNYHFHSSYSSMNKQELESKIKTLILETHGFIKKTNRVVITYGTAFVYRLKSTNEIVANCHKVSSANFTKSLLTEGEIVESFQKIYSKLKSANPQCTIILSVSPVRHLKDTLELNSVSKSILRTACHSMTEQHKDVEYFPAYELLLDDLRDYRFYKTDRLHPTEEAAEYIWEKFVNSYFSDEAKEFILIWQKIRKDLAHKPFHVESKKHQDFLKSTLKKLEELSSTIDVSNEIQKIKLQLLNL